MSRQTIPVQPSLPTRALSFTDVLRFVWQIARGDALRLFIIGLGAGLLSLTVPAVSGYVFDVILPYQDSYQLLLVFIMLLASALSLALFEFSRELLTNRINARLDFYLQSEIWDRLLRLPMYHLRQFETGDLAERAMGIKALKPFSTLLISTLLTLIFVVINVALLLSISTRLSLLAIGLIALSFLANMLLGVRQHRNFRHALAAQGQVISFAFQLLENVSKIQVAQAVQRALTQWRGHLASARLPRVRAQMNQNALITLNSGFSILASIVVFYATATFGDLDVPAFLVFNVAFTQIMTTLIGWSASLTVALTTLPYYTRLQPLIRGELEVSADAKIPPRLTGAINLRNIAFRYRHDGDWILRDLSLDIAPGEWVAITGKIGSGKSTLLRLLLGFEKPVEGRVLLDGTDLASLNIQRVRTHIGTILQNDQPIAGTIREVITSGVDLRDEDIWAAAQLACVDADIRRMPMGLATYVSENGANLSGGQVQRLLLARALVRRPTILLLDEATSALDGDTQLQVISGLRALRVTCLMVAHRPETLQYADRVYQLIDGQLQLA